MRPGGYPIAPGQADRLRDPGPSVPGRSLFVPCTEVRPRTAGQRPPVLPLALGARRRPISGVPPGTETKLLLASEIHETCVTHTLRGRNARTSRRRSRTWRWRCTAWAAVWRPSAGCWRRRGKRFIPRSRKPFGLGSCCASWRSRKEGAPQGRGLPS